MGDKKLKNKTIDSLGIIWKGDEVDGILVYGLWYSSIPASAPEFDVRLWPSKVEWKPWKLFGEDWCIWMLEIAVKGWPNPEDWNQTIYNILRSMKKHGAIIAWMGIEGHFADPPSLFHPDEMSEGVWAAIGKDDTFYPPPALDELFQTFSDEILLKLRKEAGLPINF
jgi:hypothetical protein